MMNLVSSWSHYLDFQCNHCGETTHVDAAIDFSDTVACRSDRCRSSPQQIEAVAKDDRFVLIGLSAGSRGCRQPTPA